MGAARYLSMSSKKGPVKRVKKGPLII